MASIRMEFLETLSGEGIYIDLNDVLDILKNSQKKSKYTIIFNDGDILRDVKMRKSVYDKFIKLKQKKGTKR